MDSVAVYPIVFSHVFPWLTDAPFYRPPFRGAGGLGQTCFHLVLGNLTGKNKSLTWKGYKAGKPEVFGVRWQSILRIA